VSPQYSIEITRNGTINNNTYTPKHKFKICPTFYLISRDHNDYIYVLQYRRKKVKYKFNHQFCVLFIKIKIIICMLLNINIKNIHYFLNKIKKHLYVYSKYICIIVSSSFLCSITKRKSLELKTLLNQIKLANKVIILWLFSSCKLLIIIFGPC